MSSSLKRKFKELSVDETNKYKIHKIEINNNVNSSVIIFKVKNVEKSKILNCQIHSNFNSCMIYNCPGISTKRYSENCKNIDKKINYDYYS